MAPGAGMRISTPRIAYREGRLGLCAGAANKGLSPHQEPKSRRQNPRRGPSGGWLCCCSASCTVAVLGASRGSEGASSCGGMRSRAAAKSRLSSAEDPRSASSWRSKDSILASRADGCKCTGLRLDILTLTCV